MIVVIFTVYRSISISDHMRTRFMFVYAVYEISKTIGFLIRSKDRTEIIMRVQYACHTAIHRGFEFIFFILYNI
jgi:hypothetical protein